MTISYPLTAPTTPAPAAVRIRPSVVTGMSVSPFTGQTQVYKYAAQAWMLDVRLPPMFRAEAEEWIAFMLALNGRYGTFSMGDPARQRPRGSLLGTPLVNGAGQTGQTLDTDGWAANETGVLLKGDYIQIGTNLYSVLNDVDADAGGNATLDIFPRLRTAPADNATVTCTGTVGLWRMTTDELDFGVGVDGMYDISFSAMEAL